MAKVIFWSLCMVLGLFMIVSAFSGVNVALMQNTTPDTDSVVATMTRSGSTPTTNQALPKRVIGLRFKAGSWSDPYNDALWQGVANALRETPEGSFEVVLYDETSLLAKDVELVFTAGPPSRPLETDAKNYPATQFVVLDNSTQRLGNIPKNFHEITFEEHETSYLLGYLAGTLSQTGQVGFVGDTRTATRANEAAFSQGLLAACSQCQLHSESVARSSDLALGVAAAQTLTRKGADIIFADAGSSSQGVIRYINDTMCASAVKTRPSPLTSALTFVAKNINYLSRCADSYPLFFIGTGWYQPIFGDNDRDPSSLNHGLTSLAKHIDVAVYKTIQTFMTGDTPETSHLTLKDEAVGIAVDDYNRALLPEEVLSRLETIKTKLISGEIVIDTVTKK